MPTCNQLPYTCMLPLITTSVLQDSLIRRQKSHTWLRSARGARVRSHKGCVDLALPHVGMHACALTLKHTRARIYVYTHGRI